MSRYFMIGEHFVYLRLKLSFLLFVCRRAQFGGMPKRKWANLTRQLPVYDSAFRRSLPSNASVSDRLAIATAAGVHEDIRTHDTSHLMISEEFETKRGGALTFEFYDPVKLVQHVLDHAAGLAQHYGEIAMRRGEIPWRLVCGFDEQTPGSKVNADNRRKCMVFVINFLEVACDCLELDDSWFIPLVLRENLHRAVKGGWSAVLRRLLRRMLVGPDSFTNRGVLVRCNYEGRPFVVQIKAVLDSLLTDGEGIQVALQWNGPSSMKPTFDFANIFKKNAGMADPARGWMDIARSDWQAMRRWQRLDWIMLIRGVLDDRGRFLRGEILEKRLKASIMSAGFCVTPLGLLADEGLHEIVGFLNVFKYDFMHTAFQDGYMSNAMYLITNAVFRVKYNKASDASPVIAFLSALQFPFRRAECRRLKRVFCDKLMKKHSKRKCIVANASTQLSLYKLLEFWAIEEASDCPALLEHCAVYSAACSATDVFVDVKHRRKETTRAKEELFVLVGQWQALHKAKYGTAHFRPKFFWLWACSFSVASTEWLFDMFTVERQHKRVKWLAELIKNTVQFEGSVLQRVLDDQMIKLQTFDPVAKGYGLAARSVHSLCGGIPALIADSFKWKGVLFHVDDIVKAENLQVVGIIIACYKLQDGQLVALVEIMRRHDRVQFEHTSEQQFWQAHGLRHMIAWRVRGPRAYDIFGK